jgi:predicted amidohydrolase YtcJ
VTLAHAERSRRLVGGLDDLIVKALVFVPELGAKIEVAIKRISPEDRTAEPFLPGEALDLSTALRAFTIGSAWVNHLDDITDSIEVGKLADLAVPDRDILGPEMGPLGETRVLLTLVEGTAVHEAPSLEPR